MRSIIRETDPDQPVSNVAALDDLVRGSSRERQAYSVLFTAFGLVALLLAALGIYGLMSHMVARKTAEIGIRVILGVRAPQVMAMVLRLTVLMTIAGLAIGLFVSMILSRILQSLLFEVSPYDSITFTVVPVVIAAIAWLASWIPARRATRIDPASALRTE